ncbi:MAG: indolepyruvate oxidoreductase subunit beta [Clostridia bacterium]|nr:indolepyruvate oxidoreductase subunit beta [Clostridia bacterium]
MMNNCLLCGVGGQGTVLASRLIAQAAMERRFFARTAETIGMAQRGGCVVSHVRIGDDCQSSIIPLGGADVLAGFEPGEAVRCLNYLKKNGLAVVSRTPVHPVMNSLTGEPYSADEMIEFLRGNAARLIVLDAYEIAKECASARVLNVAILGAVAASGELPVSLDDVEKALRTKIKPQHLDMNLKALAIGAKAKEERL